MVPLIDSSELAVSTAEWIRIAESCGRDLSRVFILWLREDRNQADDLLSIARQAAKREGAGQDFQTVAILGFAADAGILSDPEVAALKKGLTRLAGRSPLVNGVPMPFCADAVGILGIALGTAIIADAEVTGWVVGWATRFLKSAYERDRAEDWQRCLFAAADLKMGTALKLSIPNSIAAAHVRLALQAKKLIRCPDTQVRQGKARTLEIANQELSGEIDCERAALCLAGIEWVTRRDCEGDDRSGAFADQIATNRLHQWNKDKPSDMDARPRNKRGRPVKISDELKVRALAVQGTKTRAQILYQCQYPTIQQQRNVTTILKHFRNKSTKD